MSINSVCAAILLCGIGLCGCVQTNEVAMSPNTIRLDTRASGLLFAGQAGSETQKRAAELTLQNGYTHFRLEQVQTGQGRELAGVQTFANGNVVGDMNAVAYNGSAISTPIYRPTSSVGVTVVMFHANEPGAQGAFDAAEVLRRLKAQG